MPEEALEKANAELSKLKMMSPMSAEASVVRGYLDWMVSIPWFKRSKVRHDLKRAQTVLDEDHFGLEEVKERILEYLAVQKRVRKLKGPVLASLDRQVLVKRLWVNQLLARRTENLSGWRWVVFATKRRSEAIDEPISAPCPASCCRRCRRPV